MNNHFSTKQFSYTLFLLLLLPNIVFISVTYWTGDHRAIFNFDYLLPLLCFVSNIRLLRIFGVLLYLIIFIIDILLIVLQHYPNLHFMDSFYLLSFIFLGPKIFLIYALLVTGLLLFEIALLWKLSKKISFKNLLVTTLLLLLTNISFYFIRKDNNPDFEFYNTSLATSNTLFFVQNQKANFSNLLGGDLLGPSPYQHATKTWTDAILEKQPLNNKLLLIVVESWGQPLNASIQDDVIKNLKAETDYFEYFSQDSFPFRGFTVEGELRELCQLYPTTIDLYQIKTGFQNCLPHTLTSMGYETQAIHGGGSHIYGRQEWYPKAGFKTSTFQENLNLPAKCIPFDGICDWDILPFIKNSFAQDKKLFNYWLTLTSHYSYYKHDIHNTRFNCSTYNIPKESDACHSFMLQAQFFDHIAELIKSPEMLGVEVIIVGDHPPPLFKAEEVALYKTKEMKDGHVGWMHFKINKTVE